MNVPSLEGGKLEAVAESASTRIIIRLLLMPLIATSVAGGGWFLARQADTLERVERRAIEAKQAAELLGQSIDLRAKARDTQFTSLDGKVSDHEIRLRSLERPGGPR